MLNFVMQLILPASPMMMQQGLAFDWGRFIQLYAKQNNHPELLNMLKNVSPSPYESSDRASVKPPVTTRNYQRTSVPQSSREGNTQALLQLAAGANPQSSQMRGLGAG